MTRISKKQKSIREQLQNNKTYSPDEAVKILKKYASKKFLESIDISVNLGIDPKKSDQSVRGATNLPKGTGKSVKVAVFAQGENADKAKEAGADLVGFEDLAEDIKSGNFNFDVLIATPDAMKLVGQLGQILGPRGLMPNPKVGTVTPNVASAVKDAKTGQIRYRADKNGIIHCPVGTAELKDDYIVENISALLTDLKKLKPATSKGVYIKKVCLSSTMGPGITLDISTLSV